MQFTLEPIGLIHSPYKQKFGIPRQPGLVSHAKGRIEMLGRFNRLEAFEGIEQYSHLWIEFYFHQTAQAEWKPSVRPPRLGGNKKIGCFATRSNFRPNNLGLSVVRFEGIYQQQGQLYIEISGHDLLDQTPILDIKPYIPYSDSLVDASAGDFADAPEAPLSVTFSESVTEHIKQLETQYPDFSLFIQEVLAQDPRPAYMSTKANRNDFTVRLYDYDIKWQVENDQVLVTDIQHIESPE